MDRCGYLKTFCKLVWWDGGMEHDWFTYGSGAWPRTEDQLIIFLIREDQLIKQLTTRISLFDVAPRHRDNLHGLYVSLNCYSRLFSLSLVGDNKQCVFFLCLLLSTPHLPCHHIIHDSQLHRVVCVSGRLLQWWSVRMLNRGFILTDF